MWDMAEIIWNGNDYEERVVYVQCITMLWQDKIWDNNGFVSCMKIIQRWKFSLKISIFNFIQLKFNFYKNKYYIKSKGDFVSHKYNDKKNVEN